MGTMVEGMFDMYRCTKRFTIQRASVQRPQHREEKLYIAVKTLKTKFSSGNSTIFKGRTFVNGY